MCVCVHLRALLAIHVLMWRRARGKGERRRLGDKSIVKKSDLSRRPKKMEESRESVVDRKLNHAVPQPRPVGGAINPQ